MERYDPGWYQRDPEELLDYVEVDDLVERAEALLDRHARGLVLDGWVREWAKEYLEAEVWGGLTGLEEDSHLFGILSVYIEPDALAELGCEARRRGEEIAWEDD